MQDVFRAIPVSPHVYWVGAVDWALRDFHGYATLRGTSYNAFLIPGPEPVLIDTVKAPFADEMLARIASVLDPGRIRHVVSNHSEMDHTGGLPELLRRATPTLYASVMGAKALKEHFGLADVLPVKDGQTLELGGVNLRCFETRMVHWPDSMLTWYAQDGVLFSNDAFGMHLATGERFTDQVPQDIVFHEAAKYYANILMPLSTQVRRALDRLGELNLPIQLLATDHGPIWRADIPRIFECYARWSQHPPTTKAVVVYDTMWQSTARMAQAVGEGLTAGGASPVLMPLAGCHRSDVATELLEAGALLVGSPVLNNNIFPTLADVLTYLKGLKPRNLVGAAFGSYGWSGEAVGQLNEILRSMKVELVSEGVRTLYVPTGEALAQCRALGQAVARRLVEGPPAGGGAAPAPGATPPPGGSAP